MRTHGTSPGQARFIADLPDKMAEGLQRCHDIHVPVTPNRRHHAGVHSNTIRALVRHELIYETRVSSMRQRIYRPTENGLRILLAETPRFLKRAAGYTTEPVQRLAARRDPAPFSPTSMADEPEAVDEATLVDFAAKNNERHASIKAGMDQALFAQQRSLESRLALLRQLAQQRGLDARDELRLVERALNTLERKIRDQRNGLDRKKAA